jgi:LacI family transcriptional regulator
LNWIGGYKRHLEVYAGCQKYADEAGWQCTINPAIDRMLTREGSRIPYDGIIARATKPIADAARRAGVPLVKVWVNSPVQDLPSVFPDFEESGVMAAGHLLRRGFRQFGYLGYQREIDSHNQHLGFCKTIRATGFPCNTHRFSRNSVSGNAPGWKAFVVGLEQWIDTWRPPSASSFARIFIAAT